MAALIFFGVPMLATAVVAIPLCRYRSAHHKRVSYGTLVVSALIANVICLVAFGVYQDGWHIFTLEAWTGGKGGFSAIMKVVLTSTITSLLPALAVAVYYQKRGMRDTNDKV